MTIALLLVLVLPLSLAIISIIENANQITIWAKSLASFEMPPPPEWLDRLPLVGGAAMRAWERLATTGIGELAPKVAPYAGEVTRWFISQAGSVGSCAFLAYRRCRSHFVCEW